MKQADNADREKLAKLKRLQNLQRHYALFMYRPYPKQKEFHNAGKYYRERCFFAGNQLGKTLSAAQETAMHATGLYPDWWDGKRFTRATRGWVGSKNSDMARDGAQRLLFGPLTAPGTGSIPKDRIVEKKMARGVPNALESITVLHTSGDLSHIGFKAYTDGREAWQAETLDYIWYDEEPPYDVYMEGLTRTNATKGIVYITFTPLLGMSQVVRLFIQPEVASPDRVSIRMTIDDVDHIDEDEKKRIIARYPPHEQEARIRGLPMLGEGAIFQIAESEISEDPLIEIPETWRQIIGLDFGWTHPTAAARLAYEPENDVIHVVSQYRAKGALPCVHAAAIKPWGAWIPVAWPKDGLQTDKGSGLQVAKMYRDEGLNLTSDFAQFGDKRGVGVEAGILEMIQRMQTGRFKIGRHLDKFWEEYRNYHRVDGKIHDVGEDLICAARYGTMMIRYAQTAWDNNQRDRWAEDRRRGRSGRSWMSS